MKNIKYILSKKLTYVFIISFLVFFVIGISILTNLIKQNKNYEFNRINVDINNLSSEIGSYNQDLDAIISKNTNGIFVNSPIMSLEKGIYIISIEYNIPQTSNVSIKCYSKQNPYNAIIQDQYILNANQTKLSFPIYINKNLNDFEIILSNNINETSEEDLSFYKISIEKDNQIFAKKTLSVGLLIVLVGVVTLIVNMNKEKQKHIFSITIISILSSICLMFPYFAMGHDISFHLLRIEGIAQELLNGTFPVKMQTIWLNGAGYPVSVFYGDFLLYIPAIFRICGFSVINSYQIFLFIINVLTTITIYWSIYKLSNKNLKLTYITTLLYVLSPYRLCCLYLRAAVGEFSAMIFIPLLIYAFIHLLSKDTKEQHYFAKGYIPLSISVFGLLQTHMLSIEMCGIFCFIVCIVFIHKVFRKNTFLALSLGTISGFLLSLSFVIPFVDFAKDGRKVFSQETIKNRIQTNGLYVSQLFQIDFNGNGTSLQANDGIFNEMPLGIGIGLLISIAIICYILYKNGIKKNKLSFILLVLSLFALTMTTVHFPWDTLSNINDTLATIISSIQFPWRFLTIASALIPFSIGLLSIEKEDYNKTLYICFISIVTLFGIHFQNNIYNSSSLVYKPISTESLNSTSGGGWEYILEDSQTSVLLANENPITIDCDLNTWYRKTGKTYICLENTKETSEVIMPITFEKYWVARDLDTKEIISIENYYGLVKFNNINNVKNIVIAFEQPTLWKISYIINFIFIFLFVVYVFYVCLHKNNQRKEKYENFNDNHIEEKELEKNEIMEFIKIEDNIEKSSTS